MRPIIITLTIFLLIIGPTSCLLFESPCPNVLPYFKINGLEISNLEFTEQGLNPWKNIGESESIAWNKYFLRVGFQKTFHAALQKFNVGANVFATSCDKNGAAGSKIGVDTLFVISLNDYNADYHANDTLNNIALINYWTYKASDFDNFFSIARYVSENQQRILEETFEIKIKQPPSKSSEEHQFKIVLILRNGEVFQQSGAKVRLTL